MNKRRCLLFLLMTGLLSTAAWSQSKTDSLWNVWNDPTAADKSNPKINVANAQHQPGQRLHSGEFAA